MSAAGGRWPFLIDLWVFGYDAYMPWLVVFFKVIMTTEGQSTEVLSSDRKKFMLVTESTVALIGYKPVCLSNVAASRFRVPPISQTNLLEGGNHFIISITRFLEPSQKKGLSLITNFQTKHGVRVSLQELCHRSYLWLAFEE